MAPAQEACLVELANSHICVPTNAGASVLSLAAGMMADADCIAPIIMKELSSCAPLHAKRLGEHRPANSFTIVVGPLSIASDMNSGDETRADGEDPRDGRPRVKGNPVNTTPAKNTIAPMLEPV